MLIYAVDDERLMLSTLVSAIKEAEPDATIRDFRQTDLLLNAMERNGEVPDVVFMDIEMSELSGIALAKRVKEISPKTNIVFATGFSEYALEAMSLYPSGYMMKPVTTEMIRRELDNLRFPIEPKDKKKLCVRTFQNFEVYSGGKPVVFERNKAKELFAYLIDRSGSRVTYAEIAVILWEDGLYDRSRQKQLQVFLHSMMKTLKEVGAEDVIVKNRTGVMVDVAKIDCDAYRFVEGDITAINAYRGEYMSSYAWAEFTNGRFTPRAND